MIRKPPTPEELFERMLEPFEDEDEFALRLDREMERTLAMTPAEIRADLVAMGYDVAALEKEARAFFETLAKPRKRSWGKGRLLSVAAPIAILAGLADALPNVGPELLPMAANAPNVDPPAVTAAAPTPPTLEDGGSR